MAPTTRTAARTARSAPDLGSTSPTIQACLPSYRLALQAAGKADATVDRMYLPELEKLDRYLELIGHSRRVGAIRREHLEAYLVSLRDAPGRRGQKMSPASIAKAFRSLRPFFTWALREDEIEADPMERMQRPPVPEKFVKPLTVDEIRRLFKACEGRTFEQRRDTALVAVLLETGARRGEVAGLRTADVNVHGSRDRGGFLTFRAENSKSKRDRTVAIGAGAAHYLDRYLRSRREHPAAFTEALWLATRGRGALSGNGILQVLRRRAKAAGIEGAYVHRFRHTMAHDRLASGMSEGAVMQHGGWRNPAMLRHYSGELAMERAQDEAAKHSSVDRILGSR